MPLTERPRRSDPPSPDAETRFERGQAAADQRGEEIEDKIGEAAQVERVRLEGADDIARAVADAIRLTQTDRKIADTPLTAGLDFVQAGTALSRALGVAQGENGRSPLPNDPARFGLLLDRALRSGLDGGSIEGLIRAVKASPEQRLPDATRAGLVDRLQIEQSLSPRGAERVVADLETAARLLPDALTIHTQPNASKAAES